MTTDYVEDFQIGRVVSRTFGVISRNAAAFFAISAILMLPVLLVTLFVTRNSPVLTPAAIAGNLGQYFSVLFFTALVQIICAYLLQASLVQGTITDLNGERPGFGTILGAGFSVVVPVIIIAILSLLGIVLGMILLVVPGIMLAVAWAVVIPVRVVEKTGIGESFGRSRALTKGNRWRIFWLVLMYALIAFVLGLLINVVMGAGLLTPSPAAINAAPFIVVAWIERVVLAVITGAGVASIYYELRTVKEGVAPQQLAAAFD